MASLEPRWYHNAGGRLTPSAAEWRGGGGRCREEAGPLKGGKDEGRELPPLDGGRVGPRRRRRRGFGVWCVVCVSALERPPWEDYLGGRAGYAAARLPYPGQHRQRGPRNATATTATAAYEPTLLSLLTCTYSLPLARPTAGDSARCVYPSPTHLFSRGLAPIEKRTRKHN